MTQAFISLLLKHLFEVHSPGKWFAEKHQDKFVFSMTAALLQNHF